MTTPAEKVRPPDTGAQQFWRGQGGRDATETTMTEVCFTINSVKRAQRAEGPEQNGRRAGKNSENIIVVGRDRFGIKRGNSENAQSVEMSGDPGVSLSSLVTTSNSHTFSESAFHLQK